MSYSRPDALSHWGDGPIRIHDRSELDLVLGCPIPIGDHESVYFVGLKWDDDADGVIANSDYVVGAAQEAMVKGVLPAPADELPKLGTRVETIEVGGRPSPGCGYGVGTVTALSWDHIFQTWRVDVEFDRCTGGWQGFPVYGTSTFPWMVHVIDSDERPFSDMTPTEIEALYESRRPQLAKPTRSNSRAQKVSPDDVTKAVSARDRMLAHFGRGMITISSESALRTLLVCPPEIAVRGHIGFTGRSSRDGGTSEGRWVANALAQVVAAGVLPAPTSELPEFGAVIETIGLANRQLPPYGWVVGTVEWLTWREGTWHVSVRFDHAVEMRRGGRLRNFSTPASMVRAVGSNERPFSEMNPAEIKQLFQRLRQRS